MEAPPALAASLHDRYRLERELGRGGMATVWLARDLKHERPVALKVLRPELSAVLGPERFLREIRLSASLQHSHILPLLDSGEAGGFLYYVMPYVAGESLRQRLQREGPLPLEEALRLTRAVASALDYAHAQGVIHRDIKPENILLYQGEPMAADFGIALAVSQAGEGRLTETGLSLGTSMARLGWLLALAVIRVASPAEAQLTTSASACLGSRRSRMLDDRRAGHADAAARRSVPLKQLQQPAA